MPHISKRAVYEGASNPTTWRHVGHLAPPFYIGEIASRPVWCPIDRDRSLGLLDATLILVDRLGLYSE
jgi:hypothetical protein